MLLADPGYGLKLGASHDVRDNGLIGFLALNSPTLDDALANVERYVAVTNEGIDAVFERDGPWPALRFRETDPSLRGLRHNSEQAAAQIVIGARELTRKKACPLRVEFMHGAAQRAHRLRRHPRLSDQVRRPNGMASSIATRPCGCR